jgi:cystathionine gamma-synthase
MTRPTKAQRFETLAVHAGQPVDPATGAVVPPIHMSTTFERDADGEYPRGFFYGRHGNPNRRALEECVAALEGGAEAIAFGSGLAVPTAVIQGLQPGDHIIAPDDVYHGFRRVLDTVYAQWGLEVSFIDLTNLEAVRGAIRQNTRLLWIESPSNPLLKIADLAALAGIAREAGIASVCDGTFATPVLQRPLELGVDLVAHSTTKAIGGHSDVTGGVLIARDAAHPLFARARKSQEIGGMVPSPFDCWLTLRGIATLPYRVRAQSESAARIAAFLEGHAKVARVHYPGLASHAGHLLAKRQMRAFGGVLSFEVKGSGDDAMRLAANTQVFLRATSLGGTHSLIEHRASIEGPGSKTPPTLLRVSVGLEHVDDLIEDLDAALAAIADR